MTIAHALIRRRTAVAAPATAALALASTLAAAAPAAAQNPLAPIWSGIYAGVHGGMSWVDVDTDAIRGLDTEAARFGGHLGLNVGLGLLVVGVEADLDIASTSFERRGVLGLGYKASAEASGSVRARVGLPVGPALFYATAGYAWSDIDLSVTDATGARVKSSSSFDGIVYGVGAEALVLPRILVRLEALHYDYGSTRLDLGALGSTIQTFDPSETVVRAGVSFRFN